MKTINQIKNLQFFGSLLLFSIILFINGCKKENTKPSESLPPTAHIFVANEDDQTISVINGLTMQKITDINVSEPSISMVMPHNVQVAPNGKSVWATAMGMGSSDSDQVIVINPETNQVIKRIHLGIGLHLAHVVLDSECNNAFVTAYDSNKVFQINTSTYSVINTFNLNPLTGPHGMRYSSGKLYIANMDAKSMTIIDISTNNITYIPLGGVAVQTAVTKNNTYAFVTLYDTREVVRYNIQTKQITKIGLPFGSEGPIQIYPTPDNKHLYVCDQGGLLGRPTSNKVYVIDIENASVTNTILVGNKVHGVVVDNYGAYAYVTNVDDNTVVKINTVNNTVEGTVSTGLAPNGIGYWYGHGGME